MGALDDKVAVITGAASGLGRGMAIAMARAGAQIVVSDVRDTPVDGGFESDSRSTVDVILEAGGDAVFQACDVRDAAAMDALIQHAEDTFGGVDVMVNNAGVYRRGNLIHEIGSDELELCWQVNVVGAFNGSQASLKSFLRRQTKGVILNVVSTAGLRAHRRQAAYNMSKAAVANLTRCIALEYGRHGIRANGICPTYVKTSLLRDVYEDEAAAEAIVAKLPLRRFAEVEDVASLAVFLASEEGSFIDGALIPVDGGETL